eukprot:6887312-Alexandrium_andersonii.AAC.1
MIAAVAALPPALGAVPAPPYTDVAPPRAVEMASASRKRQASQEAPEVRPHRPLRLLTPRHLE